MFENLTQRERILAMTVLALIPISAIFFGVFTFINAYNANGEEEMALAGKIKTENERMLAGAQAGKRQSYYNSVSLPPSINAASNEYQQWLKLLLEEVQLDVSSVKPVNSGQLITRPGQPEIGNSRTISAQVKGDLQQLNEFLTRFYDVNLLHRINTIKVTPLTEGTGAKKVRNGQLSIFLTVEIMSLAQADNRDEFTDSLLARTSDDFQGILRRNVFGPANNTPLVRARPSTYTTGNKGSFTISAEDADKQDLLTFELIESSVKEATLEQSRPEDRRARFTVPSQEPGKYEFKVKVTDSGFPPKESIETFAVTFKDPPPPRVEPKPEPKPEFKHATQTRITGIARNKDGDWQAWISVRTLDQRYRLKEGESFELDGESWLITKITEDEVKLKAGEREFVARPNPVDRGKLIEITPPAETTTTTAAKVEGQGL